MIYRCSVQLTSTLHLAGGLGAGWRLQRRDAVRQKVEQLAQVRRVVPRLQPLRHVALRGMAKRVASESLQKRYCLCPQQGNRTAGGHARWYPASSCCATYLSRAEHGKTPGRWRLAAACCCKSVVSPPPATAPCGIPSGSPSRCRTGNPLAMVFIRCNLPVSSERERTQASDWAASALLAARGLHSLPGIGKCRLRVGIHRFQLVVQLETSLRAHWATLGPATRALDSDVETRVPGCRIIVTMYS